MLSSRSLKPSSTDHQTSLYPDLSTDESLANEASLLNLADTATEASSTPQSHDAVVGPFLRYAGVRGSDWLGSVLLVVRSHSEGGAPQLHLQQTHRDADTASTAAATSTAVIPQLLDSWADHHFYRYDLSVSMHATLSTICSYSFAYASTGPVSIHGANSWTFHVVPQSLAHWRWAFTSCNGFSLAVPQERREKMGGLQALWLDMLRQHRQDPFHVQVGGGDQIYCDAIWKQPRLKEWLRIKGKENRRDAPWTGELDQDCNRFYFETYSNHFGQPVIRDALATIPALNMLDDHDVWDGCGSYPTYLEVSNVFQNLRRIAYRYYLLFQHHTTPRFAVKDDFLGGVDRGTYSLLRPLGTSVAVLCLDTRSERTRQQVISETSYNQVFDTLHQLDPAVRHLVVVVGVPVVYPRMEAADTIMNGLGTVKHAVNKSFKKVTTGLGKGISKVFGEQVESKFQLSVQNFKTGMGKTGVMKSVLNHFGEPELADDLIDHWTHSYHTAERKKMVERFQEFSKDKGVRVTFLAGDVHCAAVGRFFGSDEDVPDHRLMYQIVSSAIGNVPPPPAILSSLNRNAKKIRFNEHTKEQMLPVFSQDVDGKRLRQNKLLGRRNWCAVDANDSGDSAGNLTFSLQMEALDHRQPSVAYPVQVPALLRESDEKKVQQPQEERDCEC